MAVVRRQVLVQFASIEERVDPSQQMVGRNVVVQVKRIEKWRLPGLLKTHHRDKFRSIDGMKFDQVQTFDSTEFFNGIGRFETVAQPLRTAKQR